MRDLSDIVLKPSDFPVLAEACRNDPGFPATYDGWIELMRVAEAQARQRGMYPTPLFLDPEVFVAWCKSVDVVPCLDALRAFAILKRGKFSGAFSQFLDDGFSSEDIGDDEPKPLARGKFVTDPKLLHRIPSRRLELRL